MSEVSIGTSFTFTLSKTPPVVKVVIGDKVITSTQVKDKLVDAGSKYIFSKTSRIAILVDDGINIISVRRDTYGAGIQ